MDTNSRPWVCQIWLYSSTKVKVWFNKRLCGWSGRFKPNTDIYPCVPVYRLLDSLLFLAKNICFAFGWSLPLPSLVIPLGVDCSTAMLTKCLVDIFMCGRIIKTNKCPLAHSCEICNHHHVPNIYNFLEGAAMSVKSCTQIMISYQSVPGVGRVDPERSGPQLQSRFCCRIFFSVSAWWKKQKDLLACSFKNLRRATEVVFFKKCPIQKSVTQILCRYYLPALLFHKIHISVTVKNNWLYKMLYSISKYPNSMLAIICCCCHIITIILIILIIYIFF